jgi:hypothetical protein
MKTNQKQLKLIQHGLKASTVTKLSESQVNILFNRLNESKKENKEQITPVTEPTKTAYKIGEKGGNLPPAPKGYSVTKDTSTNTYMAKANESEMTEDTDSEMEWLMKGDTQDPIQKGPTGDGDPDSLQEYKSLAEKFESKKQQKYFFAKCGDGKTKEQKKWCKMAEEFADKTNFKKLPEKKKTEAKESGLNNLVNKVSAAYAGGVKNKLNSMSPSVTFGENEIEKKIMKLVEKHITPKMTKREFLNLVKEQGPKTAPSIPGVRPDVDTPTRPSKPGTPYLPKPGVKPAPKAKQKVPSWLSFKSLGIKLK